MKKGDQGHLQVNEPPKPTTYQEARETEFQIRERPRQEPGKKESGKGKNNKPSCHRSRLFEKKKGGRVLPGMQGEKVL